MSWARNASSLGAGLVPYTVAALFVAAVNKQFIPLPPATQWPIFATLVLGSLVVTFFATYIVGFLDKGDFAHVARLGLSLNFVGQILVGTAVGLTGPDTLGTPALTMARFFLLAVIVTTPMAIAGAVSGSLRSNPKVRPW